MVSIDKISASNSKFENLRWTPYYYYYFLLPENIVRGYLGKKKWSHKNSNPSPLSSQPTISIPHTLNLVALLAHEIWPITFLSLVDARQLRIIAEFYSALKYG